MCQESHVCIVNFQSIDQDNYEVRKVYIRKSDTCQSAVTWIDLSGSSSVIFRSLRLPLP